MEPLQPVDPHVDRSPAIPQARPGQSRTEEPPPEFGAIPGAPSPEQPAESAPLDDPAAAASPGIPQTGAAGTVTATGPESELPSVWNVRSISLVILAVVMAVCTAGGAAGYVMYNRAAEPDRSTPGVVTRQYVEALFNDRDTGTANRFVCDSPDLGEIEAKLAEITAWEAEYDSNDTISLGSYEETGTGDTATVETELQISGSVMRRLESWQFTLAEESGWRVCGAERLD